MTDLISQMSEIERTAETIVTAASEKKDQIFKEAEDKKKAFDEELKQDVEERIHYLRESLYLKKDQDMKNLKTSTQKSIEDIQKIYEEQHTILAQEIVNRIVGA